jgi:U3 small nucleolar RNA-associated protein 12
MLDFVSVLPLSSKHRISQLQFHPSKDFLAVQTHDKSIDVFRIRSEDEIRKKQARRRKREREKGKGKEASKDEKDDEAPNSTEEVKLVDLFTPYLVVRASGKIRSFAFSDNESNQRGGVLVSF